MIVLDFFYKFVLNDQGSNKIAPPKKLTGMYHCMLTAVESFINIQSPWAKIQIFATCLFYDVIISYG